MFVLLPSGEGSLGKGDFDRIFESPKSFGLAPSPSSLFTADCGAEELVGVVTSIGSPGEGADVWMVGVRIGTVRAVIVSSGPSGRGFTGALSVAVAIGAVSKSNS